VLIQSDRQHRSTKSGLPARRSARRKRDPRTEGRAGKAAL